MARKPLRDFEDRRHMPIEGEHCRNCADHHTSQFRMPCTRCYLAAPVAVSYFARVLTVQQEAEL